MTFAKIRARSSILRSRPNAISGPASATTISAKRGELPLKLLGRVTHHRDVQRSEPVYELADGEPGDLCGPTDADNFVLVKTNRLLNQFGGTFDELFY